MSQFAKLFEVVKKGNEDQPKKTSQKIQERKSVTEKTTKQKGSETNLQDQKKNSDLEPDILGKTDISNEKLNAKVRAVGKSRNEDYTQVLTYIRKDTHRRIKKTLIDDPDRNLSDLVEELLNNWLEKSKND